MFGLIIPKCLKDRAKLILLHVVCGTELKIFSTCSNINALVPRHVFVEHPIQSSASLYDYSLGAFSPLSSLGDIGRMLVNAQGVFTSSGTNTPPEESPLKDDDVEVPNKKRYILLYILLKC